MITYNELLEIFKNRTSCRSFTNEDVNEEDILKIVEAGMWTASAHNDQSVRIIRIKNNKLKEILKIRTSQIMTNTTTFDPFYGAKELFLVVANGSCASYDGSLAIGNMMLAATSLDLGSCWINTAQIESQLNNSLIKLICNYFNLNNNFIGIGYLIIGHPKFNSEIKERKSNRYFEI